eukprot:2558650-Rhodomonas_salina.5
MLNERGTSWCQAQSTVLTIDIVAARGLEAMDSGNAAAAPRGDERPVHDRAGGLGQAEDQGRPSRGSTCVM